MTGSGVGVIPPEGGGLGLSGTVGRAPIDGGHFINDPFVIIDAVGGSEGVVDIAVSASTSAVGADEPLGVSASPRCEAPAASSQPSFAIDACALREACR